MYRLVHFYSMPGSILFIFRKRLNFVVPAVLLLLTLFL